MKNQMVFMLVLLWTAIPSFAQKSVKIDEGQVNKLVLRLKDSLHIPGIAVGIAAGNEIRYTNVFGYANIETDTPLALNSVWHICSISKQFSTVACLKLAEEKKISINDKISDYIDDLRPEYSGITLLHLLSQTSGIKDYLNEYRLYGVPWDKVSAQILSDTLNFKPGTSWRYSNTGFWMAAKVVEKVTGMSYNQFLQQNFFDVLHMGNTQRISGEKIIEGRVNGYEFRNGKYYNAIDDISKFYGQGDGDLMSTVYDLLSWNMALAHGQIISEGSLETMWSETSAMNYGMGWFLKNINGDKVVWTPGSGFGFSTSSMYLPQYDLSVVVFCNISQFLMADEIGSAIIALIVQ
jgi:CubicO group peptidase (beta-lactamase class C family)